MNKNKRYLNSQFRVYTRGEREREYGIKNCIEKAQVHTHHKGLLKAKGPNRH